MSFLFFLSLVHKFSFVNCIFSSYFSHSSPCFSLFTFTLWCYFTPLYPYFLFSFPPFRSSPHSFFLSSTSCMSSFTYFFFPVTVILSKHHYFTLFFSPLFSYSMFSFLPFLSSPHSFFNYFRLSFISLFFHVTLSFSLASLPTSRCFLPLHPLTPCSLSHYFLVPIFTFISCFFSSSLLSFFFSLSSLFRL